MFECVINISEGRALDTIRAIAAAGSDSLADCHHDAIHHRSVLTLINQRDQLVHDVKAVARRAVKLLDLRDHEGVHPRIGVLDVVPFVALHEGDRPQAREMRDQTAAWLARELGLGVYLYGDERSLPQLRREVRDGQPADRGPRTIDPRIGASAVGERPPLVAWNIWLRGLSLADTHHLARSLRSPALRTLALPYGELTQLSCNLVDLDNCGPATVFDQVARVHRDHIERCELVGLIPASVLARTEQSRWAQLDLSPAATIESRL